MKNKKTAIALAAVASIILLSASSCDIAVFAQKEC